MLEGSLAFLMGVMVSCDVGFKNSTRVLSRHIRKRQSLRTEKEVRPSVRRDKVDVKILEILEINGF